MALHRPELPLSGEHGLATGYRTITRCRRCGFVIGFGDRCDLCLERSPDQDDPPGWYRGRHNSEWAGTVDELIIQGDDDEAELLLLRLIEATEAEAEAYDVPPFERYFRRLAQIARQRGDERLEAHVEQRYEACVERTRH
jgi:hypothetical protein